MTLNVQHPASVKVNGEDIPTTEEFTYLASIVRHDGGAGKGQQESPQQGQKRM